MFISYFSKWLFSCRSVPKCPPQLCQFSWTAPSLMYFQERETWLQKARDARSTTKNKERNKENILPVEDRNKTLKRRCLTKDTSNVHWKKKQNKTQHHPTESKWKITKEIKGHAFSKGFFCFYNQLFLHRQLKHTNILCEKYF